MPPTCIPSSFVLGLTAKLLIKVFNPSINKNRSKETFKNITILNKSVILIQMCKYELKNKKEQEYVLNLIKNILLDAQNLL